ncbi:hypothetical protein RJT34_06223 [Clitoria ternatea]|uniref:Uncharacterized protein n=1 Tax=Clitoria ternatea TaxID=43366 RepID=A0AAN9PRN7_CLITE
MQSLQQKASDWSGVPTDDAFAIDDTNLFQKIGLQSFVNLSTNFYNRVYDDEEEWFRLIFTSSEKENAIQNQYEFFVQRMGGPPLFTQRRGLLMALQPRIIACGNSIAAFAMAVRFLTGPAIMAAASIAVGLKGVLLHVAIVQLVSDTDYQRFYGGTILVATDLSLQISAAA